MTPQEALVVEYAALIKPLLPLACKAYGSRDSISPAHTASREYTRLLIEFHEKNGSLPKLADALEQNYSGLRRRVVSASCPPEPRKQRQKFTDSDYKVEIKAIRSAKCRSTEAYHDAILEAHERGMSLTRIAKGLGLSGAYPLYYGSNRAKSRRSE